MIRKRIFALLLAAAAVGCGTAGGVSENVAEQRPENEQAKQAPTPDPILRRQIGEIAEEAKGTVGVYAVMLETGESVGWNANERFAMQSVVKVPISLAVLKRVAKGELRLDDKVPFSKDELVPSGMHSPLRDKNPEGGEATVEELIELATSVSDGTASDVLQRLAGGAKGVQGFIDSLGIVEMEVRHSHKEFYRQSKLQFENWATPVGAVALLTELKEAAEGKAGEGDEEAIKKEHADLVLRFMTETPTGPNRLKGLLPPETKVAHKTGTSGTRDGITAATNDVGIVRLPDGRHLAIAVFVGNSKADEKTREAVIAKIAKVVWDRWSDHSQ